MAILTGATAESATIIGQDDGEVNSAGGYTNFGAAVSITAGTIPSTATGSYKYRLNHETNGNNASMILRPATPTGTVQWVGFYNVTYDGSGTIGRAELLYVGSATPASAKIQLSWNVSSDGKVHLYEAGTEIDSANAFSISQSTDFGIIVRYVLASKAISVYYWTTGDAHTSGNWTAAQTGTLTNAPASWETYIGESLAKLFNPNHSIYLDNFTIQDTSGSSATSMDQDYWEGVMDGVPNAEGGNYNGWLDTAGNACSTGGSNCYADVDEWPTQNTADYIKLTSVTNLTVYRQSFDCSNTIITSGDVIGAVRPIAMSYPTTGDPSWEYKLLLYDGTLVEGGGRSSSGADAYRWVGWLPYDTKPSGGAWDASTAISVEVGIYYIPFATDASVDERADLFGKIVYYRPGTAVAEPPRHSGILAGAAAGVSIV